MEFESLSFGILVLGRRVLEFSRVLENHGFGILECEFWNLARVLEMGVLELVVEYSE